MAREKRVMQNAITEGVIWKQLLLFFFPIVLGTFFQQLYNTADAIIVGKFVGKEALAAVGGTTGTLINLLVGFFVGLSSGASGHHFPILWRAAVRGCFPCRAYDNGSGAGQRRSADRAGHLSEQKRTHHDGYARRTCWITR